MQLSALEIKINHKKQFKVSLIILIAAFSIGASLIIAINAIEYLDGLESTKTGFKNFCYIFLSMSKLEYENIQILLLWTLHNRIRIVNETLR